MFDVSHNMTFLAVAFTVCCTVLFLYKSYQCFDKYLEAELVTKTSEVNQEDFPLPQICINQHRIADEKLDSLDLTYHEYTKYGNWISNYSLKNEEMIYDDLSSSFEDLVEMIVLSKMISGVSDNYEKVKFKPEETNGLTLKRCDYYDKLKCFCLTFSKELVAFGVQAISIYPRTGCYITVVTPGNFYSHSRKKSMIGYATGFKYLYNIKHSIVTSLPLAGDMCEHRMDWREDDCKLNFINRQIINKFNCTVPWLLHFARYIQFIKVENNNFYQDDKAKYHYMQPGP